MAGFLGFRILDLRPIDMATDLFQRAADAIRVPGKLHSRSIGEKLALPPTQLPHVNASVSGAASAASTYREFYDPESRDYIAQRYARDIELFGYSFD